MMELLLSYSPDLEVKTHLMRLTPLHVAVTVRHFSSASLLLEAGADVEAQTDCGERPLHIAIKQNDARMVRVRAVRIFSAVVGCSWLSCVLHSAALSLSLSLSRSV